MRTRQTKHRRDLPIISNWPGIIMSPPLLPCSLPWRRPLLEGFVLCAAWARRESADEQGIETLGTAPRLMSLLAAPTGSRLLGRRLAVGGRGRWSVGGHGLGDRLSFADNWC